MPRILDTIPDFEQYARKASIEAPFLRELLWKERYRAAHPELIDAFVEQFGSLEGMHAVVRELSRVRPRAREAAPVVARLVEEVEPALRELLEMPEAPEPLHVIMVGTFAANAAVGRVGGDQVVFHCLEWYQGASPAKVLVAHETTHALHDSLAAKAPQRDLLWTAFYEGVAIRASRELARGRPEADYFWYGVDGFDDWVPWCRERRDELMQRMRDSLGDESAHEVLFGAGFVEGRWRVGYFLADELVGALGSPLRDLVRLTPDEAREAVRSVLG